MTVYFHGNFGLNREYMAAVLAAGLDNPKASASDIAAPFGYKAPFTARYRSWLNKTGLTTKNKVTELTPMGQVIWRNDPELTSVVTQWFLHHELTGDAERAESWHFFATEFIVNRLQFTLDDLRDGLSMQLMPHHPTHFGKDAPMIKVIARKIVQCYTQPEALGALELLSYDGTRRYSVQSPSDLGPWNTVSALEQEFS